MLSYFIAVAVPLSLWILLPKFLGSGDRARGWLLVACALYFISYFIPSPLVHGQQTQFMTHIVGGGLFSGFLWVYIIGAKQFKLQSMLWEVGSLFALVCSLGVANELFEAVLYWSGHMPHGISDTTWDLVANTIGAFSFYLVYIFTREVYHERRRNR